MTDVDTLKAELRFCIENGNYGPRTGVVLRDALDFVEEIERERERTEVKT